MEERLIRARDEAARWRQKAKELEMRLQKVKSGDSVATGNMGGVTGEVYRPVNVEGHKISTNDKKGDME